MDGLIKAWLGTLRAQELPYLLHCRDKDMSDQTFITSLVLQTQFVLTHQYFLT
jgi:hypothetical protein